MQLVKFILEGFKTEGWVAMVLIFVVAIIVAGLVLERVWYLYIRCGTSSGMFMTGISKYLKAGDYEKAIKYSSSVKTPLAKGITAILENRGKSAKQIQKSVDEIFLSETPKITRHIPFLSTLANLSTLLGLTGTIFGLMIAFEAIANVPVAQRAQVLASGITLAMSTTLFGLIIAVPTIFLHGILAGKSDKVIEEMDEKTAKLINIIEEN